MLDNKAVRGKILTELSIMGRSDKKPKLVQGILVSSHKECYIMSFQNMFLF